MADERVSLLPADEEEESFTADDLLKYRQQITIGACALLAILLLGWWFGRGPAKSTGTGIKEEALNLHRDLRLAWLRLNASPNWLPLSYQIDPPDYFEKVPETQKPRNHFAPSFGPPECPPEDVKAASLSDWDQYTFQTEKMVVAKGCNIYDAAIGSIALAVGGQPDLASSFYRDVLDPGATAGLRSIRGDAKCKGRQAFGECDPQKDGSCGLCYGDKNETMTPATRQSWFFRMISDQYAYQDAENALCPLAKTQVAKKDPNTPDRPRYWTWIDWKPVLGDNAWPLLTGVAHVLWQDSKGRPTLIADDAPELLLALDFLASLKRMVAGASGGVYFCPRNTYYGSTGVDIGSLVSTENNASLLAGLKALRYLLKAMKRPAFSKQIQEIDGLIAGIHKYMRSAYDTKKQHFRTGGKWNVQTQSMEWDDVVFAVDCQSWVGSVLGPGLIDRWFGSGAALKLWDKTKAVAGYAPQPNGMVKGVGYSKNDEDQVRLPWSGWARDAGFRANPHEPVTSASL